MVKIIADVHERDSGVPELLSELGAEVELKKLSVADYIVSESTAVERKSAQDYINSLFSGRLFDQAVRLKEAYERAVVVIEGDPKGSLENERAVWGSLFSLSLDMGIAVLQTQSSYETAEAIFSLARREQEEKKSKPRIRPKPKMLEFYEKQLFLVAGLPKIGTELAERLLEHFGTPRKVFSATKKELMEVEGIGRKKAEEISRILDVQYRKLKQERL